MSTRALILVIVAGAAVRAVVLPLPGTRDVPDWKATSFVASSDFTGVYGRGGWPPDERKLVWHDLRPVTTEYPPISQLEMAGVGLIYRRIDPDFRDSASLTALIKAPGLIAEIVFVIAVLTWGRRLLGERAALWAAAAFWLNPGIWMTGPVLGYLDAQMAIPATLAFLAVWGRRPRLGGVLAAIAVLTKPQAIFILPVLGLAIHDVEGRRWRPVIQAGIAGLLVAVLAILPFVVAGTWPSLWRATQRLGEHDLVSGTATNLWWIVTWVAGSIARLDELGVLGAISRPATMVRITTAMSAGIPNPRMIGTLLTLAALGWAVWRARRGLSRPAGLALAAWCVLAYFMLSAQVHENHAFLALPLLGVAAAETPRLRPVFWAISLVYVLNLYLFYGFGMSLPAAIDRGWTFVDLSLIVAAVYVAVVVWLTAEVAALTAPVRPGPRES